MIELKNPGDENATLEGAFNQLQTYKDQIPSLFRTNTVLVTSDGAPRAPRLADGQPRTVHALAHRGRLRCRTEGLPGARDHHRGRVREDPVPDPDSGLHCVRDTGSGLVKIVAGYHQFHAVRHAVESTIEAASPEGDRRIGVIWHTQGSGKSLLMAFYAGQIIAHPAMENPTVVVITDRNDLDDQLFGTFVMCRDLLRRPRSRPTAGKICRRSSPAPQGASCSRPSRNSRRSAAKRTTRC